MKVTENIPYAAEYGSYTVGDLYIPEKTDKNTILVLCIHGGAWGSMDKSRMKDIAGFLCRKINAIVYNINYRLCGEHKWPACMEDCLVAARFLLYGRIPQIPEEVRKKQLFILGASSGGHLALMTGLHLAPEEVCGMISISGINSVKEDHAFSPGRYTHLFGHKAKEEELNTADPVKFLTENMPPVLCTHDRMDNVVPCQCTETFISEAGKKGIAASSYFYCREEKGFSHRIFIPGSTQLYSDIEEIISQWIKNIQKERCNHELYS